MLTTFFLTATAAITGICRFQCDIDNGRIVNVDIVAFHCQQCKVKCIDIGSDYPAPSFSFFPVCVPFSVTNAPKILQQRLGVGQRKHFCANWRFCATMQRSHGGELTAVLKIHFTQDEKKKHSNGSLMITNTVFLLIRAPGASKIVFWQ